MHKILLGLCLYLRLVTIYVIIYTMEYTYDITSQEFGTSYCQVSEESKSHVRPKRRLQKLSTIDWPISIRKKEKKLDYSTPWNQNTQIKYTVDNLTTKRKNLWKLPYSNASSFQQRIVGLNFRWVKLSITENRISWYNLLTSICKQIQI